jgi:CheY-like chemotaxis protein
MEKRTTFLIVDDNFDLRDTLHTYLTQLGCAVDSVENGYRGIEKSRDHRYDVILLDVKMPGIDGIETAERMKKDRKNAFIVLMTAFSMEELAERAFKAGVDGIIIKPFDVQKLLTYIEKRREASLYFSLLEKVWKHIEESLGVKRARFLFEGVVKKGLTKDRKATFLERTGDGIFVNRYGGNGESPIEGEMPLMTTLEQILEKAKERFERES